MKATLRNALLVTATWIAVFWFLIPAGANLFLGRKSLVRLDPRVSKDYDCIFIEGHSARRFTLSWLSSGTPIQHLRLRYTPNGKDQEYGIFFVDPQTLAYEAHDHWVSGPS